MWRVSSLSAAYTIVAAGQPVVRGVLVVKKVIHCHGHDQPDLFLPVNLSANNYVRLTHNRPVFTAPRRS